MNFRSVTLRYLGWCPGVKAVASFVPDKEIPDIYLLSAALMLIISVGAIQLYSPRTPVTVDTVYIGGDEYPMRLFNASYDYSTLTDKTVDINEPLDWSEFREGDNLAQQVELESLRALETLLEERNAPKIIVKYALWAANATWDEAVKRYYNGSKDPDQVNGFLKQFGRPQGDNVWYIIERLHPENGNFLLVEKMYLKAPGVHNALWAIKIKIYDSPPYPGEFFIRGKRCA